MAFSKLLALFNRRAKASNPFTEGFTTLNILEAFPSFIPNSWGLYEDKAALTLLSINQTIQALEKLALHGDAKPVNIQSIEDFLVAKKSHGRAEYLQSLFICYGSDKGAPHNYHIAYDRIIGEPENVEKIFEVGLGTNNSDVVSTMGNGGRPGASLKAFREFCPNAFIYGADYDRRILFAEERIHTFFVDQTDPSTFVCLGQEIGDRFDLMIDDGLHAPNANLHSLAFFLPRLKVGGWAVIEDISLSSSAIWSIVALILSGRFQCHLVEAKSSLLFLVKRLE